MSCRLTHTITRENNTPTYSICSLSELCQRHICFSFRSHFQFLYFSCQRQTIQLCCHICLVKQKSPLSIQSSRQHNKSVMSFLLLKSNRKVQQGGSEQQRFGAGNIRNSNSLPVATLTPTSSSRTASSFTTSNNSITPQYNRLLNNGSSVVTPMSRAANAGDGQLQLLRSSQNQFQKKNYNSQAQNMTNQRSFDSQNMMEIVSMEEGE